MPTPQNRRLPLPPRPPLRQLPPQRLPKLRRPMAMRLNTLRTAREKLTAPGVRSIKSRIIERVAIGEPKIPLWKGLTSRGPI